MHYRRLIRIIADLPWEFKWRFIKKHQYHVVRPRTLRPGYHDSDERMLHACMETLVEHYELLKKRNPTETWEDDIPDGGEHDGGWGHARREMKSVYEWWTRLRPERIKKLDDFYSSEWKPGVEGSLRAMALEDAGDAEDQAMLHRLVDIRQFLWD